MNHYSIAWPAIAASNRGALRMSIATAQEWRDHAFGVAKHDFAGIAAASGRSRLQGISLQTAEMFLRHVVSET
jgi:hypothetical protein